MLVIVMATWINYMLAFDREQTMHSEVCQARVGDQVPHNTRLRSFLSKQQQHGAQTSQDHTDTKNHGGDFACSNPVGGMQYYTNVALACHLPLVLGEDLV